MHWLIWPASLAYFVLYPELGFPLARRTNRRALWQGSRTVPAIALTFDDGPDPEYTPRVLRLLQRESIRATFFLVGERARRYPELVSLIRAQGHEVGNHGDTWTFSHQLSDPEFEEDLLRAETSLGIAGEDPKLFRPAGGFIRDSQIAILEKHDYALVLATGLPFDFFGLPSGWIAALTIRSLRRGSILVLHDSGGDRNGTVTALPKIVAAARRRGLEFVTVSQLRGTLPSGLRS